MSEKPSLDETGPSVAQRDASAQPAALAPRGTSTSTSTVTVTTATRPRRWWRALVIALPLLLINLVAWRAANPPLPAAAALPQFQGMAYNAFGRFDSPLEERLPLDESVAADLKLLAGLTKHLRTYSASEFPALPDMARQHGMALTLGVWLDRRADNNALEVDAAIVAANKHRNVHRIIAGNETLLHGVMTKEDLFTALDKLRKRVRVPVSTAEPWHVWLSEPELAQHVDFVTVHLLPYWEGVPVEAALDEAMRRLREVRERFPNKHVAIGEIGWPSGGDDVKYARATPSAQAAFVRAFLERAARDGISDYFLMEAIDQPWKRATEGRVGAHWGLFNAAREPKFSFRGPVQHDPYWPAKAALSSVLGLVSMLLVLRAFAHLRLSARWLVAASIQGVATAVTVITALPLLEYLRTVDWLLLALLVPAVGLMATMLMSHLLEFAEMFWHRRQLRRRESVKPWPLEREQPFVSIHLACCNEPPSMVIATIDSLLALHWSAYEIIVVDNNTHDDALWRPVQAHVSNWQAKNPSVAARLRFVHLPHWPGYKAGALNVALEHTDATAQWVAVVDADYIVERDWLLQLAGWFDADDVGAVQSPQAHRDWQRDALARMMNWEYDGFFRIGMHHRHERNAVVQHGTMTIVRAQALRRLGGWDVDSVCEDTELGVRLLRERLRVVYVDRVFGTGLVPDDFAAYARQRKRWARGAMQIMKRHAGALVGLPGVGRLTLAQRYHFVAGWLPWIGDAVHLMCTLAVMVWSVGRLTMPALFGLPVPLFAMPLVVFFLARALLLPLLYWRCVPCRMRDTMGAAVAGMALSHSVARGVFAGLVTRRAVFEVTRKAGHANEVLGGSPRPRSAVREERALLLGLAVCAAALVIDAGAVDAILGAWLLVIGLQAVPYVSALVCDRLGRRRPDAPAPRPTPTAPVRSPSRRLIVVPSRAGAVSSEAAGAVGAPATATATSRATATADSFAPVALGDAVNPLGRSDPQTPVRAAA
jgi:exo-beta-1,3-glucanase (GH17 family)/cellulose synthase/poly-beta-1,6-N-acetylglucosamine synthase-like glycosyltransferase